MKKFLACMIALVLTATSIFAQREETIIGDTGLGFSGAWGGWSYNFGQLNRDVSPYNGGIWALEFGKKLTVGGLHYKIQNMPLDNLNAFDLRSNSLLLGYSPVSYRPIHPIITVGVGGGTLSVTGEQADRVFMLHPAAGVEFNLVRWCHVDAQVGYRAVMDTDVARFSDRNFSGLYGQVNLKFGFSWGRYRTTRSADRDRDRRDRD
jgi:hypothetical protein